MEVAQNYKIGAQKPQVLYVLGGPGSGKGTQCERLVRDYKFEHISVGEVMRAEIQSGSKEGEKIKYLVEKGQIVPTEITVSLLLKAIKSKKASRYLIDGFPRGIEQALYLEKSFREIDFILNFDVPEEVLVDRLLKRAATSSRADDNPETIKNRIRVFYESTAPILDTYWRIGRVGNVSGIGEIGEIYQNVRQAIIPNLIFLYGAPSVGKSLVAQKLCAHTGYRYLSLQEFYKVNNCNTDVEKINKLMKFLGESADRNFIIDSFLDNKAQSVVFFEHFGKPRYVIYLQQSKDEIEGNIRKYSKTDQEKKNRLQQLQIFLKNRDELLTFFQQYPFFKIIQAQDVIQSMVNTLNEIIRPRVMVAQVYNNKDLADNYLVRLEKELGYVHLNMEEICEEEIQRGSSLGRQIQAFSNSGQPIPAQMQVDLLRKILYCNPQNTKFVLTHFPEKKIDFEVFEKNLFKIDGFINFMKPNQEISYSAKLNPLLHYISENKCLTIRNPDLEIFKAFITKRTKFGIIFGPSNSGKSTLAKYIGQKYGYQVVEWEPTIAQLKEKLGPPGEPLEDLPLPKLVDYYRKLFDPVLKENVLITRYLFDGFPPGCENKTQIDLFLSMGKPTWILGVNLSKDTLWRRFKLKNELDATQEMQPEDDEKISQMLQNGEQYFQIINEYIQSQSDSKFYQIDANHSLEFTQRAIDYIFQKRVFLARNLLVNYSEEEQTNIRIAFLNIAAQRNMTFIDVENLIQQSSSLNNVKSEYDMRWTENPITYPSNFSPELVVKMILQHIQSLQTDNRDLLLWGYPSADHQLKKKNEETLYPRVTDEILYIEKNIGPIRIAYVITDKYLDTQINDPEWELQKPEDKPAQKAEGDGEEEKQEQQLEEGDENKPKFNIYEYTWTNSNGRPKNIAQIFSQIKNPQSENLEVNDYSLKLISDHFENSYGRVKDDLNANYFVQIQLQH